MSRFKFLEKNDNLEKEIFSENDSWNFNLIEMCDRLDRRIERLEEIRRNVALNCLRNHRFSPEAERRLFDGI
jgi:hypothetical protein